MGDISSAEKLPKNHFILISLTFSKNDEVETVYGILIKDSHSPMLSVY